MEKRFDGGSLFDRVRAWWLGFKECRNACGITWDGLPNDWRLNDAYDAGRRFRWRVRGAR
jgi:hypothetical protein